MTTIDHIDSILTDHELKSARLPGDHILTGFVTQHYRDALGRQGVPIVISVREGGAFLGLDVPCAYRVPASCAHRAAAMQALLEVGYRAKMLRFGYDPNDGEVRASIELPLMDAELGAEQFMRALTAIPDLLDRNDAMIRGAIETGKIERASSGPSLAAALAAEFLSGCIPPAEGGFISEDAATWTHRAPKTTGLN